MTTRTRTKTQRGPRPVDVHLVLQERGEIAVTWSIQDVKSIRPELDDQQCWRVLKQFVTFYDADIGFTWMLIRRVADEMFPQPGNGHAEGGRDDQA